MISKVENIIVPVFLGRVSSEDQQERGTIQNQIDFVKKYADLHQLDIRDYYLDDGISGTIPLDQRPEGKRLLDDAKAGKFNLILIYKLDRLGRSARIVLNAVHELESYNVKIKSMTEPFDTGDPSGRFLLTILAGVADLERETILERMWHGANRVARTGKWLGGIVPFGYHTNQEGFLEITETPIPGFELSEEHVIEMIYRLTVEQDYNCYQIADYFNALGIPPSYVKDGRQVKKGKRKENTAGIWRPARIGNMIRNETYKGIHRYGKRTKKEREIISREVPAIVPEELWDKAQIALKEHRLESFSNVRHRYLLRGLIKCGNCGLTFSGTVYWSRGEKYKAVYRCNGKTLYRGAFNGKCTAKNIPADWIEEIVWGKIIEFVGNPKKAIDGFIVNSSSKDKTYLKRESEMLSKAINDKDIERSGILDLFRKKVISQSEVESQLNKINIEKDQLTERLEQLNKRISDGQELTNQISSMETILATLKKRLKEELTFDVKREFIKALVSHIKIIYNDEEIVPEIHFKFLKS